MARLYSPVFYLAEEGSSTLMGVETDLETKCHSLPFSRVIRSLAWVFPPFLNPSPSPLAGPGWQPAALVFADHCSWHMKGSSRGQKHLRHLWLTTEEGTTAILSPSILSEYPAVPGAVLFQLKKCVAFAMVRTFLPGTSCCKPCLVSALSSHVFSS